MKDLFTKGYDAVLQETSDFFASQGVSILGEGYKEIASNAALFESYVDQLTEGVTADHAADMAQLMVNTNAGILRESSMTGIQPIASLSMPIIRKLWPKFGLKEAVETEVAKTPRLVITYTAPYMMRGEERIELPRGLKNPAEQSIADGIPAALNKSFTEEHTLTLEAGKAEVVDFTYLNGKDDAVDTKVKIASTPSAAKLQPLDELIFVSAKSGEETIKINKRLGVYGNGVFSFTGGQLIVQFDGAARKATFAAIGGPVALTVKAAVSSEYNEDSWSVGFDLKRLDIDIPTGQHLNAPLPIEALNDMMALYQIDGTKETVDLMTNTFAQKLDLEILHFIKESHLHQQQCIAFQDNTYGDVDDFTFMFDCKPAVGFAGSPKAWREEIKPMIDHLAQKIKNQTYLQSGMFTIVGNPIDIQILANVDWQFRGGQGGNMDGVDVDYSVGTYVGANSYKVVASTNVPAGQLFVLFLPSGGTQMTYKYYPYTFSTEMGYIDPNRSRVPSIMMTKRHTMQAFMDAIGCIVIANNDGKSYFRESIPTSTWKDTTPGYGESEL